MRVKLTCPDFSYVGWNRVQVEFIPFIGGLKMRSARIDEVCRQLNLINDDPPNVYPSVDCFFIHGAESFGLGDLAEAIAGVTDYNVEYSFP